MQAKARTLGKTSIKILPFSFGGASISGESGGYGFGPISDEDTDKLLSFVFDEVGVRLFDSAPIYGFGDSERRLGKFFRKRGGGLREQVFLTSKSGVSWHDNRRINMTNDPKITERMLLQSLKDLQTDYIDLYFIHWPDARVDIRRPMEVLANYHRKGVIRHLGLCNTHRDDWELARQVAPIEVFQSEYNLFNRAPEEKIFPLCSQAGGAGFMAWGVLDKGILSGSFDINRQRHSSDGRVGSPWFKRAEVLKKLERVEEVKRLGRERWGSEWSIKDFSLAYCWKNMPEGSTLLWGGKSVEQWRDGMASLVRAVSWWEESEEIQDFIKNLEV